MTNACRRRARRLDGGAGAHRRQSGRRTGASCGVAIGHAGDRWRRPADAAPASPFRPGQRASGSRTPRNQAASAPASLPGKAAAAAVRRRPAGARRAISDKREEMTEIRHCVSDRQQRVHGRSWRLQVEALTQAGRTLPRKQKERLHEQLGNWPRKKKASGSAMAADDRLPGARRARPHPCPGRRRPVAPEEAELRRARRARTQCRFGPRALRERSFRCAIRKQTAGHLRPAGSWHSASSTASKPTRPVRRAGSPRPTPWRTAAIRPSPAGEGKRWLSAVTWSRQPTRCGLEEQRQQIGRPRTLRTPHRRLEAQEQAATLNTEQFAAQLQSRRRRGGAANGPNDNNGVRPMTCSGEITPWATPLPNSGENLAALEEPFRTASERKGYLDAQAADLGKRWKP